MGYTIWTEPAKIQNEPESKFKNSQMGLQSLTPNTQNSNRPEPNSNKYPNAHP